MLWHHVQGGKGFYEEDMAFCDGGTYALLSMLADKC